MKILVRYLKPYWPAVFASRTAQADIRARLEPLKNLWRPETFVTGIREEVARALQR